VQVRLRCHIGPVMGWCNTGGVLQRSCTRIKLPPWYSSLVVLGCTQDDWSPTEPHSPGTQHNNTMSTNHNALVQAELNTPHGVEILAGCDNHPFIHTRPCTSCQLSDTPLPAVKNRSCVFCTIFCTARRKSQFCRLLVLRVRNACLPCSHARLCELVRTSVQTWSPRRQLRVQRPVGCTYIHVRFILSNTSRCSPCRLSGDTRHTPRVPTS
jgi:hypothetical protein